MTRVSIGSLREGAVAARGAVVVVDVYRAFTCASLLFHWGVEESILVATPGEALRLKAEDPRLLLVGEVDGKPVDGFDWGNSPSLILQAGPGSFRGRTVVQRTSAGVQGVLLALDRAEEVFLGSFTLAAATAAHIARIRPARVHIVAMGHRMESQTPEDEWCAKYIAHLLGRGSYQHEEAVREILLSESSRKFLRGDQPHYPAEDPVICLQRDLFPFALRARRDGGRVIVRKVEVAGPGAPEMADLSGSSRGTLD